MRQHDRGFIFVELVVVVAIMTMITVGASMTVVQIITGSERADDWSTVVRQAQNVGYRVSQDVMTASTITVGDDPETGDIEFVVMKWKDWESGETHDISYIWLDSAESLKRLKRAHMIRDRDGVETYNVLTMVADHIYGATLTGQSGMWTLGVEARSGDRSAVRTYEINQRFELEY